jgi:hypothetical protein
MPADTITLEDVRRLRLEPGDVLVFRLANPAPELAARIAAELSEHLPGVKCLVLDRGVDLTVARDEGSTG